MSKFKVGDTVIVEASYNESRWGGRKSWEDKVARVGRKYLYLHGDGRKAFDVETGVQKTEYSGSARTVWDPADWHASQHRKVVAQAIRDHGLRPDGFGDFKQSTSVLERVLDVLEKGEE